SVKPAKISINRRWNGFSASGMLSQGANDSGRGVNSLARLDKGLDEAQAKGWTVVKCIDHELAVGFQLIIPGVGFPFQPAALREFELGSVALL
ncbi:MAG: hypothetical protein ABI604_18175, partial [Nitrospirota bacterium]